ncbi:hypothetical protein BTVI_45186 [Pitangus sulphuratus]|nr:hypothetical protein BTVI_45186 [Pitangus sulphuratus]
MLDGTTCVVLQGPKAEEKQKGNDLLVPNEVQVHGPGDEWCVSRCPTSRWCLLHSAPSAGFLLCLWGLLIHDWIKSGCGKTPLETVSSITSQPIL